MIELAPHHKIGLPLNNPVMIASGCGGYGNAYQRLVDLAAFGAIVTNPITLRPRRGPSKPRLAETKAGFILYTGQQNPGVRKVIQQYRHLWSRLSMPVIVHLPADEPNDLRRTARALAGTDAIAAIELGLPPDAAPGDIECWIRAVGEGCHLPLLVKLPLTGAVDMVEIVAAAAADTLVIAAPPIGTARSPQHGDIVSGQHYGPALHSPVLAAVQTISSMVDLPVVAVGGIHDLPDAQVFLQAGAVAVQVDTLLFIDPGGANRIAAAYNSA